MESRPEIIFGAQMNPDKEYYCSVCGELYFLKLKECRMCGMEYCEECKSPDHGICESCFYQELEDENEL